MVGEAGTLVGAVEQCHFRRKVTRDEDEFDVRAQCDIWEKKLVGSDHSQQEGRSWECPRAD